MPQVQAASGPARNGSGRRVGACIGRWCAAWVLAMSMLVFGASGHAVADPHSPDATAKRLAEDLLNGIPSDSRIAIRPLYEDEAGLPREMARKLYESLLNATVRASANHGVEVIPRARLRQIYDSLDEFGLGDAGSMLQAARADIEIICEALPVSDGIVLSCGATDVVETKTVAHAKAPFVMERPGAPLEVAVFSIAQALVREAPETGRIERVRLLDASSGASTELSRHIATLLETEVWDLMAGRARREGNEARAREVLATAPTEDEAAKRYRLEGTLRRLDDKRFRIDARLEHHRKRLAVAGADISASSLPSGLMPGPGRAAPRAPAPERMWEAAAEAVVSERFDRDSAKRAARNLARARVVAQALDLPSPQVTQVLTEADAASALEDLLEMGVPVDERFQEQIQSEDAGERITVRLAARVVPVGTIVRPSVSARLDRAVYKAHDPIRLTIRSEETAYLGVFSWGADNRVVRLYPADGAQLRIATGETLLLPRPGQGSIRSAPMPGADNREDHEAFIVVASARPFDAAALAPMVGATLDATMKRAKDGSAFLAALAGQDPAYLALRWLPYSVHD